MATNEIELKDFLKVLFKEVRVGIIVGLALAGLNFIRLIIQYPGQYKVAMVVCLALMCTVIVAKMIGGLLPMLAKALHIDPALMASPLITTIVDTMSLVLYFTLATQILGIA